jgi:hypothetical protein
MNVREFPGDGRSSEGPARAGRRHSHGADRVSSRAAGPGRLLFVTAFLIAICDSVCPATEVPRVSASAAVNIACHSAELRGNVSSDGNDVCQYRFGYKEVGDPCGYTTTDWTGAVRQGHFFTEVVSGLRAGTTYCFAAQARNSAGLGEWSAARTFATVGLPSASTSSAADVTCTSATLWGGVVSDGGQACEYRFQYWAEGDEPSVTDWTGSVRADQSFSDTVSGLRAGTTYHFRARCRNYAGEGDWASERTFVTVGLPTVTMSAALDITCTSATLRAGVASDGGQACEYQFGYRPVGTSSYTTTDWTGSAHTGHPLSETITGLSAGTTYEYSARAQNCAGPGPWADDRRFTTSSSGIVLPTASTQPAAAVGNTNATLAGRVENDGGEPCAYQFRYGKTSPPDSLTSWTGSVTTGQSFSATVTGLEPGATYYFAAQAKNSAGEGGWGSELSFTTPSPVRTPQVITLPAADVGISSATLGGHLENDGGAPCAHRLRYKKAGGSYSYTEWIGSATTGRAFGEIISGLEAGTTYYFAAQAKNSAGEGDWGSELSFITLSLVTVPRVTTMPATAISASSATLGGYLENDGAAACAYRFRYKKAGGAYAFTSWTGSLATGQSFSKAIDALEAGTTYYFAAQARNSAGESGWGNELSFLTASSVKPPKVTTMSASSVGATSATLLGYLGDDGGSSCEFRFWYYLEQAGPGAQEETAWECCTGTGQVFTCGVEGLEAGQEYVFIAEARNAAGAARGEQFSFTTGGVNSSSLPAVLYVDDDAPGDPGPNDPTVGDPQEDGSQEHPFDSIQGAIGAAGAGARVLVHAGTYRENVELLGKRISVEGLWLTDPDVFDVPVIAGAGAGPAVRFAGGVDADCQLLGFVVRSGPDGTAPAVECRGSGPVIGHCIVAGNRAALPGGAVLVFEDSDAVVSQCTICENVAEGGGAVVRSVGSAGLCVVNCIVWGNVGPVLAVAGGGPQVLYCDVQQPVAGMGNVCVDPLFARAGVWSDGGPAGPEQAEWLMGDYHLQSRRGRFRAEGGIWVVDGSGSPCVDAGDPASPCSGETPPNGGRVNLGAFGGTWQASLSGW